MKCFREKKECRCACGQNAVAKQASHRHSVFLVATLISGHFIAVVFNLVACIEPHKFSTLVHSVNLQTSAKPI